MNFQSVFYKRFFSFFYLLLCISFKIVAQEDDGFIDIKFDTRTHREKSSVDGADIIIYANDKEVQKLKTDKRGSAKAELKYGPKYRIVFSKVGLVTSYMLLNSDIPQKKKITISNFTQTILFIDKKETIIDTVRFKHPFTKWYYDRADNRFKEDADYLKEFASGIFKEDELAKELAAKQLAEKQANEKAEKEKLNALSKAREEATGQRHTAMREEYKKQRKIVGKIVTTGKSQKPVAGARVSLCNANKEQIGTTITNALGSFVLLKNEKDGNNISIDVEGVNAKYLAAGTGIAIANNNGKELKTALIDSKGKFNFRFLPAEEKMIDELVVDDADLKMDINGQILKSYENKQQPMANIALKYVDELGNVIVSVVTDAQGKFQFKSLANDAFYLFSIDEKDAQLKAGEKIVLADSKGNIIKEIQKEEGKENFNFEIVSSDRNGGITTLYYDDPWLKVIDPSRADKEQKGDLVIKEKVYFNSNDATLLPDAKRVLDEVINVMENVQDISIELSSHSDAKGSDEYNLTLSKKRAKAAVDYIISQGVNTSRITGIGYGETKLVNKCANGVDCTEEQHAENRRLEFKVLRK
jgi:outer membrane protein OmpA-like peptidoglycan-associated protein